MGASERIYTTPFEFAEQFGADLGSGSWTVEEAGTRLAVLLTGIYCHADLIAGDFTDLISGASTEQLNAHDPRFTQIIRLATRGMIYRDDPSEEGRLDNPLNLPPETTMEALAADATEGVAWFDPEAELQRGKMTTDSANL